MKIVEIGGTGLTGSKTVSMLRDGGHEVVAASPKAGVNTITGEGLGAAMAGAEVVIDVSNARSFDPQAVLKFFETSGRYLAAAATTAGMRRHVAPSIVGGDRVPEQGYFRAKIAQKQLMGYPLHDHPRDPVPGIPRQHRQWEHGRKCRQDRARPAVTCCGR
ncbi:SDR family oxidoreductase [Cupriavidus pauculus]|uniref:SDR family oxidoreductase n=1 Tax=Cupriavidus pauculus TaxID=82633 RepID=UPI0030F65D31